MQRFWTEFDRLQKLAIVLIVLALAIIGTLQVFSRYVLGSAYSWTEESSRFLLIWLVLIAAAAEVSRGGHISVTMLVERFPDWSRRRLEQLNLLLVLCLSVILIFYGLQLSMRTMAQSASTLPIAIGQVYLAVPVGGVLMAINAIRRFWMVETGRVPPPNTHETTIEAS